MTAEAVKERATGAPDATDDDLPAIPIGNVVINWAGQKSKGVIIHAPEGMVPDDLRTPAIFKKIQAHQHVSLARYDRLEIFGHQDAWFVEAIVIKGSPDGAELKILRSTDFAEPDQQYFQDDTYRVIYLSGAFWVERKKDGKIMGNGRASEQLAVRALNALYPQKVGT